MRKFFIPNYMDDLPMRIWLLENNITSGWCRSFNPWEGWDIIIPHDEDATAFKLKFGLTILNDNKC